MKQVKFVHTSCQTHTCPSSVVQGAFNTCFFFLCVPDHFTMEMLKCFIVIIVVCISASMGSWSQDGFEDIAEMSPPKQVGDNNTRDDTDVNEIMPSPTISRLIALVLAAVAIWAGLAAYLYDCVQMVRNVFRECIFYSSRKATRTIILGSLLCFGSSLLKSLLIPEDEDLPLRMSLCGMATQVAFLFVWKALPNLAFPSPAVVTSLIFGLLYHSFAFSHFGSQWTFSAPLYSIVCVWAVPFAIFACLALHSHLHGFIPFPPPQIELRRRLSRMG